MERKWWTLVVVCAATFMLLLDVTIVVVALPDIQHALGASFSQLQWVTDAYALALASLLLTSGSIADKFGRRRIFSIGLVIFTLGSLLCGVAHDPVMLIVSRALQGVGGAMMVPVGRLAVIRRSGKANLVRAIAFLTWPALTAPVVAPALMSEGKKGEASTTITRPTRGPASAATRRAIWPPME